MSGLVAAPKEVSFPTDDKGVVFANTYGSGSRALILAHGARFNKESWAKQAEEFAHAGFAVVAIDFRGYGKSHGGSDSANQSANQYDDMYRDVLAAVHYVRQNGASSVAVVGASMGGRASATAVAKGKPGEIDRLVLLAHAPIQDPEKIAGTKLFIVAEGDSIAAQVKDQYQRAPEPKQLIVLSGSAHAQNLFTTDQSERVMSEILKFLGAASAATLH